MKSFIHHGTVFDTLPLIPPGSVDVVCTSPPYWRLRSYLPPDHALKHLELGNEPTPVEFVANLVRVLRLVRDRLADHGTVWLNMGDTYSATGKSGGNSSGKNANAIEAAKGLQTWNPAPTGIDAGNLCLIPWRLAIALQDDGWLVRSVVVWHKPAPMPASLTGWQWRRCRVKTKAAPRGGRADSVVRNGKPMADHHGHEFAKAQWLDCPGCKKCQHNGGYVLRKGSWRPTSSWEPVLMLAKSDEYFCDGEAVKQPPSAATVSRDQYSRILDDPDEQFAVKHDHETVCDGANLRDVWREDLAKLSKEQLLSLLVNYAELPDVWTIASEPLREKHYAAFPTRLVENCLRAGTSARGYCATCGMPWVRVVDTKSVSHPIPRGNGRPAIDVKGGNQATGSAALAPEIKTIDWRASCDCGHGRTRPARVLDPFCGSGRTGITASRLGLDFIGCELNEEYVEMSQHLLRDESPLFSGV